MDYNAVLSLFILMIRLSLFWPMSISSSWLACAEDVSPPSFQCVLTLWFNKAFQLIFSHLTLESAISPRNFGFFQWKIVFRSQAMGITYAHCFGGACLQDLSVDKARNTPTHRHTPSTFISIPSCMFTLLFLIPNQCHQFILLFSFPYCHSLISPVRNLDSTLLRACGYLSVPVYMTNLLSLASCPSSLWMPTSPSVGSSVSCWVLPLQPPQVQHPCIRLSQCGHSP